MSNQMLTIQPYKSGSVWVFDDESVGLHREPFVGDINAMIDNMVRDAGVRFADRGFTALFSASPFPGSHMMLRYVEGQVKNGTWYTCPQYDLVGWLCPALSRYFGASPEFIYVRAEPLHLPFWRRLGRWVGL